MYNTTNSTWGNLRELLHCVTNDQCTLVSNLDSGFGVALVLAIALNIGGITLAGLALTSVLELLPRTSGRPGSALLAGTWTGVTLLWMYCWLTYALPEAAGQNYIAWMVATPFYSLTLMIGVVGTVALLCVACWLTGVLLGHGPANRSLGIRRSLARLLGSKAAWAALILVVLAILVGWRGIYHAVPEVSAGPFNRGPQWWQHALNLWPLHLPVGTLWTLSRALTTIPGIVGFGVLGVASMVLPRRPSPTGSADLQTPGATAAWVSTIAASATAQIAGLVIAACIAIVVGLLAVAALALAFMIFAAYVMAYALVIAFAGMLLVGMVRR